MDVITTTVLIKAHRQKTLSRNMRKEPRAVMREYQSTVVKNSRRNRHLPEL
jgi:hypothetical protein